MSLPIGNYRPNNQYPYVLFLSSDDNGLYAEVQLTRADTYQDLLKYTAQGWRSTAFPSAARNGLFISNYPITIGSTTYLATTDQNSTLDVWAYNSEQGWSSTEMPYPNSERLNFITDDTLLYSYIIYSSGIILRLFYLRLNSSFKRYLLAENLKYGRIFLRFPQSTSFKSPRLCSI